MIFSSTAFAGNDAQADSHVQKIVDAAIGIVAAAGMASLTYKRLAELGYDDADRAFPDHDSLVIAMVRRIFQRRVAKLDRAFAAAEGGGIKAVLQAASDNVPDRDWTAYWDIAFAIRCNKQLQDRLHAETNDYDKDREEKLMSFFPPGTDPGRVDFAMMHFDGLGLIDLSSPQPLPRAEQLDLLAGIVSGRLG